MAELAQAATEETPATVTQTVTETVVTGKDGQPFDAVRAQELIDKLRAENKAAKAAQAKLAEYEATEQKRKDADLSELEKERKARAELETKLKETELREMRTRIGAEHKLPAEISELLQGDTDEVMKAHAAKLVAALPKPTVTLSATNAGNGSTAETDAQRRARLFG